MLDIVKKLKKKYQNNEYITFMSIEDKTNLLLIYHKSMINIELLQKTLIPALIQEQYLDKSSIATIKEIKEKEIDSSIFNGNIIIYNYQNKHFYSLSDDKIPTRNTSDPINDISISGPRDALVESNDINVALIQKRIKTNALTIKQYNIGKITNTNVDLMYIEETTNNKIVKKVEAILDKIDTNSLTNIGQMQSFLVNKNSLIPLVNYTSRPDYIAQSLIKGRIAILIDGIPLALILPTTFFYFFEYHDALSENYFAVIVDRIILAFAFFIAVFIEPFIVAVITFYPEFFPVSLLSTTINARKGIQASFVSEIIIVEVLFQIFRIAGTRFTQGLSSSLLVIGSLLLGRAVIEAGILSQEALFVGALSIISCYVLSNNNSFNVSINIMRWFVLLLTVLFGFVGSSTAFILILIYLSSQESLGTQYMYPLCPLNIKALFKSLVSVNFIEKISKKKKGSNKQ